MRTFSFGAGVQSMAVLVLATQRKIQYDYFLFSNVGEHAENSATLTYFYEYALPFAEEWKIPLIELHKTIRGEPVDLYDYLVADNRSVKIPVYLSNGAPGNRNCTTDWKIEVIAKWQKKHGATKDNQAVTGLGISVDEFQRARTDSGIAWQVLEYPLLDMNLSRRDCVQLIQAAGLPVPPKSSCWFCPFKRRREWIDMRRNQPDLFAKAVELEMRLNEKRRAFGKDTVRLTASHGMQPLDIAIGEQYALFEYDNVCESGFCMT